MIIGTFAYYINSFDNLNDWNNHVGVLNELRVAYGRAFLSLLIMHGQKLNIFDIIHFGYELENDTNHFFFDNSIPFDELAVMYVNEARTQYSELMAAIFELPLRRYDTSTLTSLYFESSIRSNLCYFDKVIDHVNWAMGQTLNFGILSFAILAEDDEIENWHHNNSYWCHDLTTIPEVQRMFSVIQDALMDDLSKSSEAATNQINLQMALIGPLFFIIFLVPFPIILLFYAKDIDHLIAKMLSTDDEYIEQASKNISLSNLNENNSEAIQNHSKNKINWKVVFYSIFALFIFCLFILTEDLILYFTYLLNINVGYYGSWLCNFALLRSNLNDILIDVINPVFLVSYNKSYITNLDLKNRINSLSLKL